MSITCSVSSLIGAANTINSRLFLKVFFEISNGIFLPFVAVYFANILHFSKIEIFQLLAVIPFFSRLVRPFVYFFLRPKIDLVTLNLISIIAIVIGFLVMGTNFQFWPNFIGLAIASTGQGLYRMTLRRDLAEERSDVDPSALKSTSKFFLSYVISPVLAYPFGFYTLNLWPDGGIIYLSILLLLPTLLPLLMGLRANKDKRNITDVQWRSLLDTRYFKMCLLTFLMTGLASSLVFSAPFILYKGGTTIPILELIAMSVSGTFGVFSRWIFKMKETTNVIFSILFFMIAPLFLLYGHIHDVSAVRVLAIVLLGLGNGVIYPLLLAIPNHPHWGGNIEARFFVHSVAMALGTIFNILIAVLFFYDVDNVETLKIGLLSLSLLAVVSVVVFKKGSGYLINSESNNLGF